MTKQKAKNGGEGAGRDRVTTSIPREIHSSFKEFCGEEYDLGHAASMVLAWFLEQDEVFKVALMNRRRMGDAGLRAAFCVAIKRFATEVCGEAPAKPLRDLAVNRNH